MILVRFSGTLFLERKGRLHQEAVTAFSEKPFPDKIPLVSQMPSFLPSESFKFQRNHSPMSLHTDSTPDKSPRGSNMKARRPTPRHRCLTVTQRGPATSVSTNHTGAFSGPHAVRLPAWHCLHSTCSPPSRSPGQKP